MYNIMMRREQYGSVKAVVRHNTLFQKQIPMLATMTSEKILEVVVASDGTTSLRDIFKKGDSNLFNNYRPHKPFEYAL